MSVVELPGLWLDHILLGTEEGIWLANQTPEDDATGVARDGTVTLELFSTESGVAVDLANTQVYLGGVLAYDGGAGGFQPGYDGPNSIVDLIALPPGQLLVDGDMEAGPGPEEVIDGDMEASGTAAWTPGAGAALTKETTNPHSGLQSLRVTHTGTNYPRAQQVVLTVGRTYRLRGWAHGDGTVAPAVYLGTGSGAWVGTASTAWQYFDVVGVTVNTVLILQLYGTSGWVEFDDLTVVETCPAWTPANNPLLTKETANPHSGTQSLRIAYGGTTNPIARQYVLTVGNTYRMRGYARGDGTNTPHIFDGTTQRWAGNSSTSWQAFDFSFIALSIDLRLLAGCSATGWAEFDDVVLERVGAGGDYRFVIDPTDDWASELVLLVRVVSQTVGASYTLDESYSFVVEDYVLPTVLSVSAISSTVVRAVFSEGMLRDAASGPTDALNAALYAITFQADNDRQAGVWVAVSAIAQAADTSVVGDTFDLTVDMDLSFWRTYRLTLQAIADEVGNLLDAPTAVDFASWTPPSWPGDRSFVLWEMFANDDRARDIHGDLERLLSVWQDTVDLLLWEQDRFAEIWDIDKSPEAFIDALLQDLGNPFRFDLTVLEKRKLAAILVASYKERGSAGAIVNLARFFMGITVSVTPWAEEQWILGVSELGIDTLAGPGPDNDCRELYTFTVESTTVLSDDDRRMLSLIIEEVKPAHTHYVVIDPDDYPVVEHWELGLSELGENTDLHQ